MKREMTIIQALHSEKVFRPMFEDLKSWKTWEIFLLALFSLPIDEDERKILRKHTGLRKQSKEKIRQAWVCAGRRSGKSRIAALLAIFLGCFKDWGKHLAIGEKAHIYIISVTKEQGETIMNYISGFLNSNPLLKKMVIKEVKMKIELSNGIVISCRPCSFRSPRGVSLLVVIADEICFWRYETESANRDRDVINALEPSLINIPESLLIAISTPYISQGIMAERIKKYWGKPGRILCWRASSLEMNPTLDKEYIKQAYAEDPEVAMSEWGGEFGKKTVSFVDPEVIENDVYPKRYELSPEKGIKYVAALDVSGGRGDSFALSLAFKDKIEGKEKAVQVLLRESPAPVSNIEGLVEEWSNLLKKYGIEKVFSDSYSGDIIPQQFRKYGIDVINTKKSKSKYYLNVLPLLNSGRAVLLDKTRQTEQFKLLDRKRRSGGDVIDNFFGHDDLCNVCSVSLVEAMTEEEIESFLPFSVIKRAIVKGRTVYKPKELWYKKDIWYKAFCCPSKGLYEEGRSMTFVIVHEAKLEDGTVKRVLDLLLEFESPFDPKQAIEKIVEEYKSYPNIRKIIQAKDSPDWIAADLKPHGIEVEFSEKTKSEIYEIFAVMMNKDEIELLDIEKLKTQALSLRMNSKKDDYKVEIGPEEGPDDCIAAAAGALVTFGGKPGSRNWWRFGEIDDRREYRKFYGIGDSAREIRGHPYPDVEDLTEKALKSWCAKLEEEIKDLQKKSETTFLAEKNLIQKFIDIEINPASSEKRDTREVWIERYKYLVTEITELKNRKKKFKSKKPDKESGRSSSAFR